MPTFGKGLDLRRAAEEAFEVKDVLNSTLDSETLKQTLYRQAKNQVGTQQSPRTGTPRLDGRWWPRLLLWWSSYAWGMTMGPRAPCIG